VSHGETVATVERSIYDGNAEAGFVLDMRDGRNFVVLCSPDPDVDERVTLCMHCLIDQHPELGRGLDLAREYGAAKKIGREWVADPG
jgi:hypothetical protein